MSADVVEMQAPNGADGSAKSGGGKVRLLTLDSLDGRTRARQATEEVCERLVSERGGRDRLDVRRAKGCETWAMLSAMIEDQLARYLIGEAVDVANLATLINTRRREGEVIGEPEPRDVTPSIDQWRAGESAGALSGSSLVSAASASGERNSDLPSWNAGAS